jgi:excisionase family DNA binding protein
MELKLLKARDAARMLSVSTSMIRKLVRTGRLAVVKIEGEHRFLIEDLEAFVNRYSSCHDQSLVSTVNR